MIDVEEIITFYDEHESYITLKCEYAENEVFKEVIHFMDLRFSAWKTNKGVGYYAAEFVLNVIENTDYITTPMNRKGLEALYSELVTEYPKWKRNYKSSFLDNFDNLFFSTLKDDSEDYEDSMSDIEIDKAYNEHYHKALELETYNFEFNDCLV